MPVLCASLKGYVEMLDRSSGYSSSFAQEYDLDEVRGRVFWLK